MFVADAADFEVACDRLRASERFGLDIEFRRERTYYARVDLVQVSTGDWSALIDPHKVQDLMPLWQLVADDEHEVIVHSGSQDLEIMNVQSGLIPSRIFDTQVAAAMCGFGDQVAYDRLLDAVLEVRVPKVETTSDWSRRPLTDRQIAYAIDDVRFLLELRSQLIERLESQGRVKWAMAEMEELSDPDLYSDDTSELFWSVGGVNRLRGQELSVLRELVSWREVEARRRDIPRKWLVPDDVLSDIAKRRPAQVSDIETISRLSKKVLDRDGDEILAAVARGLSKPKEEWPTPRKRNTEKRLGAATDIADLLVRLRARETGVAASYLGTKKMVQAAVSWILNGSEGRPPELMRGWRLDLVGNDLVGVVEGRVGLRLDPQGRVAIDRD